jgi:hypothetical protein
MFLDPHSSSDASHLIDPSVLDVHAPDHLNRKGPKHGIQLSQKDASAILSRFAPGAILTSYKVSTRGYNNRLYYLTAKLPSISEGERAVETSVKEAEAEEEYIIKVCGRYWHRTKTETEVVGIWLANAHAHLPTPMIREWDADGTEFGVEYTAMPQLPGSPLNLVWKHLAGKGKKSILKQLAEMVVQFKTKISSGVLPQGKIGNWVAEAVWEDGRAKRLGGFDVGPTLDGEGPWRTYKAYLRTQLDKKLRIARRQPVLEGMRVVWPRVEKLLEKLDEDETIVDDTSFVFTHGDLDAQNILVEYNDISSDTPTITAILDWEWSGMFPAEEEYFASYQFLEHDPSFFYSMLEEGGVQTPRTIPHYRQRKLLYDIKENIAPWFLTDHSEPGGEEVRKEVEIAKKILEDCLEKLGY